MSTTQWSARRIRPSRSSNRLCRAAMPHQRLQVHREGLRLRVLQRRVLRRRVLRRRARPCRESAHLLLRLRPPQLRHRPRLPLQRPRQLRLRLPPPRTRSRRRPRSIIGPKPSIVEIIGGQDASGSCISRPAYAPFTARTFCNKAVVERACSNGMASARPPQLRTKVDSGRASI